MLMMYQLQSNNVPADRYIQVTMVNIVLLRTFCINRSAQLESIRHHVSVHGADYALVHASCS